MTAMRVAIRADASRELGFGHVKRCLALAAALRQGGIEMHFFATASDVDVAAMVQGAGLDCTLLDTIDAIAPLRDYAPQIVLVDHYRLDADWHGAARAQCDAARIAVIDDLANRPLDAEMVIDHNPDPDPAAKYRPLMRRPTLLCAGLRFALLDPVYAAHPRHVYSSRVGSIGIFMGGSDAENFSAFAWQACREGAGWTGLIEIASTSANPQLDALRELCQRDPRTTLLLDAPNLAAFHARHDLQLGAGGGACWERCCLGVPSVVLVCADNQLASVPPLARGHAAVGLDARARSDAQRAELGRIVRRLIDSPDTRQALHRASLGLVDGLGAQRAAAALMTLQ